MVIPSSCGLQLARGVPGFRITAAGFVGDLLVGRVRWAWHPTGLLFAGGDPFKARTSVGAWRPLQESSK